MKKIALLVIAFVAVAGLAASFRSVSPSMVQIVADSEAPQ